MISAAVRCEPMSAGVLLGRPLQLYWNNFILTLAVDSTLASNTARSCELTIGPHIFVSILHWSSVE